MTVGSCQQACWKAIPKQQSQKQGKKPIGILEILYINCHCTLENSTKMLRAKLESINFHGSLTLKS